MNKIILILSVVCIILTVVSITAESKDKTLEIKIESSLTAALEAAGIDPKHTAKKILFNLSIQ